MRTIVLAALGYCLAMRLFELAVARRNERRLLARGGRAVVDPSLRTLVLVHVAWLVALPLEEALLGPMLASTVVRGAAFVAFLGAEALRLWCMASLGDRWNVRVLVLAGAPPVTHGPYRRFRHPNYVGAWLMIVSLPLALGLVVTPLVFAPLKLLALRRRIAVEDRALGRIPGRPA